jgi:hypothetical protein
MAGMAAALLACLFVADPARAQNAAEIAVYGIEVDVTASDAVTARANAVVAGQRTALAKALAMVAAGTDVARLPALTDSQITDMVADYAVESERSSTVRYIGRLAFSFRADAIRDYLQQNGIAYAASASPPVLVLPVMLAGGKELLWEGGNDWLAFWAQHAPPAGLVGLVVPKGDQADTAAIAADDAVAGDATKLQALAQRYGVSDVLVAMVKPDASGPGLALETRRYGVAGAAGGFQDHVAGDGADPGIAYTEAAERISQQLQQDWIDQNRISSDVEQRLTVDVAIAGFAQWVELKRRLATLGTLKQVDVVYLMTNRAELDLVFVGDQDQFSRALQQRALILKDAGGGHVTLEFAGQVQG